MNTISILSRRDSVEISSIIRKLAYEGSDVVAKKAIIALGSIGNKYSEDALTQLTKELPKGDRLDSAKKQLKYQHCLHI